MLLFACVHMLAVYLGMVVYFERGYIAVLWPAGGLFLGVLAISQLRALPVIILMVTLSQFGLIMYLFDTDAWSQAYLAVNNCLEAVLGAIFLRYLCGGIPNLGKLSHVLIFISAGALIGTFVTAMNGAWWISNQEQIKFWVVLQTW